MDGKQEAINTAKKTDAIRQLKRRGFTVTETADNGLLIEKGGFWGDFAYDSGIGKDMSHLHIGRTILLICCYGIGLIGIAYFYLGKNGKRNEVTSLISGLD
jgi:hypothetical protein